MRVKIKRNDNSLLYRFPNTESLSDEKQVFSDVLPLPATSSKDEIVMNFGGQTRVFSVRWRITPQIPAGSGYNANGSVSNPPTLPNNYDLSENTMTGIYTLLTGDNGVYTVEDQWLYLMDNFNDYLTSTSYTLYIYADDFTTLLLQVQGIANRLRLDPEGGTKGIPSQLDFVQGTLYG